MDLAELVIAVRSRDVATAKQRLDEMHRSGERAERSTSNVGTAARTTAGGMGRMNRSMAGAIAKVGGITALAAGVTKLSQAGIQAAASFERQERELSVMLGSAREAQQMFSTLQEFTAETPLQLEQVTSAAQRLLSFGTEQSQLVEQLRLLGDLALGDAQKMDTLIRAFGRVQARGHASMEEINMAMEAGVPIIERLAEELGTTQEQVFELASEGEISFRQFRSAMQSMTEEGGKFNDGMEELSETFSGRLSTAMDNVRLLAGTMFEPALEAGKDVLTTISDISEELRQMIEQARAGVDERMQQQTNERASMLEEADNYEEAKRAIEGLTEAMFQAAQETGNFEAAVEAAATVDDLRQRIDEIKRATKEAVGPIRDVKEQVQELFSRETQTGGDKWWENFTREDQINKVARVLETVQMAGGSTLSPERAQSLAQEGESAVVQWLNEQISRMSDQAGDIEEIQQRIQKILNGETITGEQGGEGGTTGAGGRPEDWWHEWEFGVLDSVSNVEQRLNEFSGTTQEEIGEVNAIIEKLMSKEFEQEHGPFFANDNTIRNLREYRQQLQSIIDLRERSFYGQPPRGAVSDRMSERQRQQVEQFRELMGGVSEQRMSDFMDSFGAESAIPDIIELTDQVGRYTQAMSEAEQGTVEFYRAQAQLQQSSRQLITVIGSEMHDVLRQFGSDLEAGVGAGQSVEQMLQSIGQTIFQIMPQLLLQAGAQLIAAGQVWIGLSLIAASGLVAFAGGMGSGGDSSGASTQSVGTQSSGSSSSLAMQSAAGSSSTQSGSTQVNIYNQNGSQVDTQERDQDGQRVIDVTIKNKVSEQLMRGDHDRAMRQSFGISRKGVPAS